MKGIIIVLSYLSLFSSILAQSIQSGYVLEYKDANRKTTLANVEIMASNAGSTITDSRGRFTLHFRTLVPGDRIDLRRVVKPGYEIFNKADLENLHISNHNEPIEIVLIRTEKLAETRRAMISNATQQANIQFEQEQCDLRRQYEQQEFDKQEYERRLKAQKLAYEEKLENIDNYIDRFIHIDLSRLNELEKKIVQLVQEGKFDEAISIYEKNNLISKLAMLGSNSRKLEADVAALNETRKQMQAEKTELLLSLNRQIDLLRMQGGTSNLQRIQQLMHDIAYADTTELEPFFTYGRELRRNAHFKEAMKLYEDLERWTLLQNDSIQYYRAKMFEGVCLYKRHRYAEANGILHDALVNYVYKLQHAADSRPYISDLAYGSNIYGKLLCKYKNYETGHDFLKYGLDLLRKYRNPEIIDYDTESQYANMLVQAADGLCRSRYLNDCVQASQEAIHILKNLYEAKPYLYRVALASAWSTLGKSFFLLGDGWENQCEDAFWTALQYYEDGRSYNPEQYRRRIAECRMSLGDFYYSRQKLNDAIQCYEWSLVVWTEEQRINPRYSEQLNAACCSLGECYYDKKEYDKALDYCKRAISIHPDEERNHALLKKLQSKTELRDELANKQGQEF